LLYVVYTCQKSFNFINAFACYKQKNISWSSLIWPTLYFMTVMLGPTWAYVHRNKLVTLQWSWLWDVISLQTLC